MINVIATLAALFSLARYVDGITGGAAALALFSRGMARGWIVGGSPLIPCYSRCRGASLARLDLADAIATFNAHAEDSASGGAFEVVRRGKSLELLHTSATYAAARQEAAADAVWSLVA